jgi:hypothetical protein
MLYAFTAPYPLKAAAELREAGYDAFCLMMLDRRRKARHTRGKTGQPVLALAGYVFAHDPDPWAVSKMRYVRAPVRFAGRWRGIPPRQAEWLLRPPQGIFHDTEAHKHQPREPLQAVKPGDLGQFTLASERVSGEVLSVDGHILTMRLNRMMLGRDVVKIALEALEAVA